jgi:hypothetical protein
LQHINARFGSARVKVFCDEALKSGRPLQPDSATYHRMGRNPTQEERDAWTQPNADQHRRRCKASLVGPDQRTAQEPLGRPALLQLNGNGSAAVRYDADRRASLGPDHPEASDKGAQRVGGLVELNLRAIDESVANAHPSDEMRAL